MQWKHKVNVIFLQKREAKLESLQVIDIRKKNNPKPEKE